ncbi:4'-phosphopantetheinyl transferase family protein [Yoonia sp. 2307UL14-13]|uniref:4'-phosphopantetheinyl transferase family protein n=1 Tax=Yoonia sp. 2307UL14-13 TaxID=3126506 RepID=UPI00309EA750
MNAPALDRLQSAAQTILPDWVAVAVSDPREASLPLLPAEEEAAITMVPKRRREFATGRACARRAMGDLGLDALPVPMGPDRAPIWPKGVRGSISHCESACIAAVTLGDALLGIDVEPYRPLKDDLIDLICTDAERSSISAALSVVPAVAARVIFCAKEAVYKAQYPITKQIINFNDLAVFSASPGIQFMAEFNRRVGQFPAGYRLGGSLFIDANFVLTGVVFPPKLPLRHS